MRKLFFLLTVITAILSFKITYSQIPLAPTNLSIDFVFSSAVSIKWEDNSTNEIGYKLERSTDGINWNIIKLLPQNVNSYSDIGLLYHTKYYYRVCAYNSNGNSDYSNVIWAITTSSFDCTVGTDSISSPYPFYTTYTDSRTQILYKKSEMVGYCNLGYIWAIYFYYNGNTTYSVNNVTIRMKSVTDTILTKFIDSGLTTVLNNQTIQFYSPPGWKGIGLNPQFIWDINKNLLIDICYHLSTPLPVNLMFYSTAATNKVWHRHKDFSNGCTLDSGSVVNMRPNFKMINVIDGVRKISENTPSGYSIEQNYPNPFNSNTKFKFKIKETGPVTLSLYDVLGRQEVVVFSEPLTPGEYEKSFSLNEHPLASGIYYYCFVANGFVSVKKMVILK